MNNLSTFCRKVADHARKWMYRPDRSSCEAGKPIPAASDLRAMKTEGKAFASLVRCDTIEYRRFYDNKAVKKTLTIPAWLNTMAERKGVNFSAALQSALKRELNIP